MDPYAGLEDDNDEWDSDENNRRTAHHNDRAARFTFNRSRPLGVNVAHNVTNRKLHGDWSGQPINTIAECEELFRAAETDEQALLYLDYLNAVSQPRGVVCSAGQQFLVTHWGSFIRINRKRCDAARV